MGSKMSMQGGRVCLRPECNNPLKTGTMYCSTSCSAQDRKRTTMVKRAQEAVPEIVEQRLPGATSELISLVGIEAAIPILQEFGTLLHEERIVLEGAPPLKRNVTESGLPDTRYGTLTINNKEYRARDALAYDTIDDMLKNGQVIFTLAIKQAAIQSVLRNDRAWRVTGATEEVQKTTKAMMHSLFRTYGKEMMEFMSYGAAFFEKEWEMRTGKEWGIEDSNKDLWGYRDLKAIHPASIKHIDYTRRGHKFNGFTQTKQVGGDAKVKVDKSLILTYDKRFRNLFGNPASAPMYPYWFWLEVTWRSFLRYLERTGTPPAIVFAPSTGYVLTADGERVQTMKYALAQAGYISYSNAAAFPSDVRDGNPLWRVQYLETQARGDQFIKAIEQLSTAMSRSIVIGDRAATQSGDAGSYNIAEMHWNVTQLHNQLVLDGLIEQANMFLLDPLVRYNYPKGIGAAYIETQTLDEMQKNRLFGLLNTMGNQQGSAAIETVDWEKVLEINDVPVLSKEDIDKAREEKMKQAVDQQKAFASVAQDSGQPLRNKDGTPPKQQQGKAEQKVKQSMEWLQYQLLNGATLPAMLTDHQAAEMVDRLIERGKVFDMHTPEDSNAQLANPYHDKLGMFASKPGGGLAQGFAKVGFGKTKFTEAEVEVFDKNVSGIQKDLSGEIRGKIQLDVYATHSMGEFGEAAGVPPGMAPLVLGVATKKDMYVNPIVSESLAGRKKHYAPVTAYGVGVPIGSKNFAKMSKSVVAHESLHKRDRKYPIPFEPDGRSLNRNNYGTIAEEGATELITNAFMVRSGRANMSDIRKIGTYRQQVYAMARAARRAYPNSPEKALSFVAIVHQTGFTRQGMKESFVGTRYFPTGINRPDSSFLSNPGTEGDFRWIMQAAKSDVKLEEEPMVDVETMQDNLMTLLYDGKYVEAVDLYIAEPTAENLMIMSEFIAKASDEQRAALFKVLGPHIKEDKDGDAESATDSPEDGNTS